ncbi:putative leucine-rich repeat-containing protein DDB_G0290503 isoform X2 [Tachysurus vachellii]|uniref:putative leucine-rich repeat-containing protein DDB_G0290503 isoform X2 n=1 Tax=Tachysurus vachellii TaxID=175792 RepID=UPI00296B4740|nr:putative leucine-rich repeat-containing protein DDB_G0290503 isoform X2 [Tachysurus vachellii]
MAWIQLLFFSLLLSFTPLTTLSRSVPVDEPDNDSESTFRTICEGMQTELSSCNQRLMDKIEYSFNIEKELSGLKEQIMLIKALHLNTSQAFLLQIADLLSDLRERGANLEAVYENLIKCQTTNNSNELEDQLKQKEKELSDLRDSNADLLSDLRERGANLEAVYENLIKCQTTNNSNELVDQLKQKEKELSDLRDSNAKLEDQLKKDISDMTHNNRELEDQLKQKEKELSDLRDSNAELEDQLKQKEKELSDLNEKNADLLSELRERGANLEAVYENLIKCQTTNNSNELEDQLKQKEKELSDLRHSNAELEDQLKQKEKELSDLRDSNAKLEDQLKKDISDMTHNNRELEDQLKQKEKELSDLRDSNAELEDQLKQKEKELSDLRHSNAELEDQLKQKEKELSDLRDSNAELEDQLKKDISDMTHNNRELEDQLKQKEKELSDLRDSNAGVKEENERLRDHLATLNETLKAKEKLEDQLKQKEKELSDLNEKNANVIERLRGDVRRLNNRVKALQISDDQLKQKEKEISDLKKVNTKLLDEKKNLQVDVTNLKNQLEEIKKESDTVSPPSVSTRSLQYDSDTAHKNLLISYDQRSVRGVKYSIERPNYPSRYDTVIAALTKTGFNSGRAYWEVQVKERLCYTVGVAAETAPRKGNIRYSPSNSYWVIQKENNQHYMLTEQPLLLHLTDKLNVIGVLIDFDTGEVAFYNSQTRTVLGIFRGNNFTQKLYPFVATCGREGPEDWPMELLDTGFPTWLPN